MPAGAAPNPKTPIVALGEALALVLQAIALAEMGLEKNPSKEEERALNDALGRLEARRAEIQAKLDAAIERSRVVAGPTAAQVAAVAELTGLVGAQTRGSVTASGAVVLATRVLTVATDVASG